MKGQAPRAARSFRKRDLKVYLGNGTRNVSVKSTLERRISHIGKSLVFVPLNYGFASEQGEPHSMLIRTKLVRRIGYIDQTSSKFCSHKGHAVCKPSPTGSAVANHRTVP